MGRMRRWVIALTVIAALSVVSAALLAQDRLKTMPGYEQYQRVARQIPTAVKSGSLGAAWTEGGTSIEYTRDGKRYRFDLPARQTIDLGTPDDRQNGRRQPSPGQPERSSRF